MEPDKLVTVVDHGSDTIKAGIGNYPEKGPQLVRIFPLSCFLCASIVFSRPLPAPSQIIPSLVTPLDDGAALDVTEPDPEKMLHPFRHGMVQDWEMVESIYNYTLYEQARPRLDPPLRVLVSLSLCEQSQGRPSRHLTAPRPAPAARMEAGRRRLAFPLGAGPHAQGPRPSPLSLPLSVPLASPRSTPPLTLPSPSHPPPTPRRRTRSTSRR